METRSTSTRHEYLWFIAPLVAAIYSVVRMFPVLPAVMQDEYVYSMAARHLSMAEAPHPNYLFSLVYQTTNLCGSEFYSCAKGLNAIFFIGTVFIVWLLGKYLFSAVAASVASTATALSPISVYVSFFMPDSMYFFLMVLSVYLALRASSEPRLRGWLFLATTLGLAALVKPHALFALPAFLIFSALVMRKGQGGTWLKIGIHQVGMLITFFALKLGVGFLLAGPAGLSFFGGNYTRSLNRFVSDAGKSDSAPKEKEPEVKATQVPATGEQAELVQASSETQGFFEVFVLQSLGQYALVLFLAGLPLILGIRALKTVVSANQAVGKQSAFVILVALLGIVMIPAVAAFQGLVATLGENTDERVISRHYEFLIPLFILAGLSLVKFVEPSKTSRMIQASVILIASAYSAIWLSGFIVPKFSDSSILMGLLFSNTVFYMLVAVVAVTVGLWAIDPIKTLNFTAFALVPLVFVSTGLLSQAALYENTGVDKADFDVAGQVSNPLLAGVSGEEIVVVGLFRPSLITAKFWIDLPRVADAVIAADGKDVSDIISPYSYALIIGDSTVSIAHEVLATGEGYQLVRIEK